MATIRLVPSTYTRSSTSRVTVTNPTYAYDNTDDTSDYAQFRGRNSSSYTYYAFLHGFNFDDVPSNANVTGFRVLIRCYRNSYQGTGSTYRLRLASQANNNYVISDTTTSTDIGTSVSVIEIPTGNLSWDNIVGYSDGFSIEMVLHATSNQYPYIYVYGAEIEVTYSLSSPRTVTTSLTGNGEIDPSGTETYYDGDEYNLVVTPTDPSATVTATRNGSAITLTQHIGEASEESNVLGTYTLVSGSFNGSGATYFQGLVGKGYNNTQTTTNYYSGGSGTIAVFTYDVGFEDIPENATITSLYMMVNGHAESTSQSSEYMCAQLISGNTALSDELNFKSVGTSNSTQTVTANVTPTVAQLENLKVQCRLGYYGGAINGATVYLEYEVSGVYYTYSTTISGDMTIAVTIGSSGPISVTSVTLDKETASLEVGGTVQLVETVLPANATNKNVTWSTSSSSVATVTNGLVTAVGSGTATITVTTVDGNKTDTCIVTVAAVVTYTYKLATSMVVGKKYLIANGNTGSVYLLTNESGDSRQLVGAAATVSSNKITITAAVKAKAEFECVRYTSGNDNTITVKSDGKYLFTNNANGLVMSDTSSLDRFWHYRDNKFWQFKSTTSDGYSDTSTEYKYYLELNSSNNYTDNHVTSPSIEDSTLPLIYIYVEDDGSTEEVYIKKNGSWVQCSKIYKKVSGSWVEQDSSTWTSILPTSANYRLIELQEA